MTTKRTGTFALLAAGLRGFGENLMRSRRAGIPTGEIFRIRGAVALSLLIAAIATLLLTPDECHAQASFQGLGDLAGGSFFSQAYGISADGGVVVGDSHSGLGREPFAWDAASGVMQGLGELPGTNHSNCTGVSADGRVVVGGSSSNSSGSVSEAFIWDAGSGMVGLGHLSGGFFRSLAHGASADGRIVVGRGHSALGNEAFIWDAASGVMQGLGDLPGGAFSSNARAISADGSAVVGRGTSLLGDEPFIWDATTGMMEGLGQLPGGSFNTSALGIAADGTVVVGYSQSSSGYEAFVWDSANGMQGLGDLPGGSFSSVARNASADGSVVVGVGRTLPGSEAVIWDAAGGIRSLQEILEVDQGLDLTGWRLVDATNVSGDGRVIVGIGRHQGQIEAFRAELGPDNVGPEVTCPEALVAECVDGGASVQIAADIFDADGDPLNVTWHVTYPDGSETTITDTITFGDPPVPVTVNLIDGQLTPTGFFFPSGDSHVDLMVSDGISDIFACSPITITVEDTQAPVVLTLMERIEVGTDPGECVATVDLDSVASPYTPVFTDVCSPDASAEHDAPAAFPLGETLVTRTVSDGAGNTLSVPQTVIVSNNEAPTANAPADVVIGHDAGLCVAASVSLGAPDAEDNCAVDSISNNAPSTFALGETEVEWYVSDAAGNTIMVTQLVTVTNADPVADAGADQVLECVSSSGHEVTLNGNASWDLDAGDILSFHWEAVDVAFVDPDIAMPTATFPLGSTTVQLTVTDQCGASSTTDLLIIITDTVAPQIQAMVVHNPVLWSPNHKMTPVFLDMLVSDECTSPADLLLSCTAESDEPDDDNGDGAFTGDVDLSDGYTQPVDISLVYNSDSGRWEGVLLLRAERDGAGDGRKYSIRCAAADDSGNLTFATVCVTVPHSQGKGKNK